MCTLSTSLSHLDYGPVYVQEPVVLTKVLHGRRSGMSEVETVQYCLSCVGRTMRSSMSRQSSFTCNWFRMLNQYCPNDNLRASQSRVLTKLTSGLLSFRVAAAMNFTPRNFCRFFSIRWCILLFCLGRLFDCGDNLVHNDCVASLQSRC